MNATGYTTWLEGEHDGEWRTYREACAEAQVAANERGVPCEITTCDDTETVILTIQPSPGFRLSERAA